MSTIERTSVTVDAVRTGKHGELTLNAHLPENAEYLIAKSAGGTIVAVPKADVPEREWDLWEDPELRAALWRGFDDTVAGRVSDLDDVLKDLELEDS